MLRTTIAFTGLIVSLAYASALAESTTTATVAPGGSVTVDARTPEYAYTIKLTVVGWDKSSVAVDQTAEKSNGVHPDIERVGNVTKITASGGTMRAKSFFGLFKYGGTTWVNWTVHVPNRLPLEAYSDNSSLQVNGVSGPLDLRTSNGRITVTDAGPKIRAVTSNGGLDVTVAALHGAAPAIALQTSNGSVRMQVPADFHTRVDTHTYNGSVDNPYATANGGGSASIRTANGNIVVTKTP